MCRTLTRLLTEPQLAEVGERGAGPATGEAGPKSDKAETLTALRVACERIGGGVMGGAYACRRKRLVLGAGRRVAGR